MQRIFQTGRLARAEKMQVQEYERDERDSFEHDQEVYKLKF